MLNFFDQKLRDELLAKRKGESKIGQNLAFVNSLDELESREEKYVLLSIKEDIGIRANLGLGGASNTWDFTLKALLNVQSNKFLSGREFLILGSLEFPDLMKSSESLKPSDPADLELLRNYTASLDQMVQSTLLKIKEYGKTPIIIGGGHNNSYPAISSSSMVLKEPIPVINIDPHADYRSLEGRHSGNGFSYARKDGYLGKYAVFGLHESYNSSAILDQFFSDSQLWFQSFESLLWRDHKELDALFKNALNWLGNQEIGLELDLDSISNFPVSALNPSGFDLNSIRHFIRSASSLKNCHYFHICEGSVGRASNQKEIDLLAKSIAYLISDFIKCSSQKRF